MPITIGDLKVYNVEEVAVSSNSRRRPSGDTIRRDAFTAAR